jgi:hypothetical protein
VSPGTRFVAKLENSTIVPSAETADWPLQSFASAPDESMLTRSVTPVERTWTKTSLTPFVSLATRFAASDSNVTTFPSAEMAGRTHHLEMVCAPDESTLTRSVVPADRSRTKMSTALFVSPTTRFVAWLANATNRPSAEIASGPKLPPSPSAPDESTLTLSVVPVERS